MCRHIAIVASKASPPLSPRKRSKRASSSAWRTSRLAIYLVVGRFFSAHV